MKVVFMLIFIGTFVVLTEARPNEPIAVTAPAAPSLWEKFKLHARHLKEKAEKYATVENAHKMYALSKPVLSQLCKGKTSKKCKVIQGLPDAKQQDPNENELLQKSEEGEESTSSSILSIKNAKKIYHHVAKPVADKLCEGSDSNHCRIVKGLPAGRVVSDNDEANSISSMNGFEDNGDSEPDSNEIPE